MLPHRFLLIPIRIEGEKPQKVRFPLAVFGEGIPRLSNLHQSPYNTPLNIIGGC